MRWIKDMLIGIGALILLALLLVIFRDREDTWL